LPTYLSLVDDRLEGQGSIHLAFGAEYPKDLTLDFNGAYIVLGRCVFVSSDGFVIESVEGGGLVQAEIDGESRLRLSASEMATQDLTITGTFDPNDFPEHCEEIFPLHFQLSLSVLARFPSRAQFTFPSYCEESPAILTGHASYGGSVLLYDHEGVLFHPHNASAERPLSVTVRGEPGTVFSLPDNTQGVGALRATGPEQILRLESGAGASSLQLLAPSSIEAISTVWTAHWGRTNQDVEDGGVLNMNENWNVQLFPNVYGQSREATLCHGIDSEHFKLTSATPSVCDAEADNRPLVSVETLGTCEMHITAESFNAGRGATDSLSVELAPNQ
jgi:hypothetical protein